MPVTIRDDNIVIDGAAVDIDFLGGLEVVQTAPGVVEINIAEPGIITTMLQDSSVTAQKLAAGSVDASKVVNGSLTVAKLVLAEFTELIQDVLGITIVSSPSITSTYNDALGTLTLTLNFAGAGAASTVARSDHSHAAPVTIRSIINAFMPNATASAINPACIAGEQMVGGGCSLNGASSLFQIIASYPPATNSWWCAIWNNTGAGQTANGYVICQESTVA